LKIGYDLTKLQTVKRWDLFETQGIVAKGLDGSRCLLVRRQALAQSTLC